MQYFIANLFVLAVETNVKGNPTTEFSARSSVDLSNMLFDSHSHLNDEKLINNVDEIVEHYQKNGIEKIVCVGYDYDSSLLAVELSNQYDSIYAAIGVHPSEAKQFNIDLSWIEEHLSNPKVVAIGEIGLDYY